MNINKTIRVIMASLVTLAASACNDDDKNLEAFNKAPLPPTPDIVPEPATVKPKAMWIDAHANFTKLATKAGIDAELKKIKDNGMNMIYLDVKPGNGYALYKSDILPPCNAIGTTTVTRDYDDYLGYFLEKCEELEIDVVASIVATGFGHQSADGQVKQGFVFDHMDQWYNKCQVRSVNGDANATVNICDAPEQPIVMLSPCHPEVRTLVCQIAEEIVRKYPKIKGLSLDYLRYCNNDNGWYGMGDNDLAAYAAYWGESIPEKTEIVTLTGGIGPKFSKWVEYRSAQVHDMLAEIRQTVKAVNPDCEIHLWASAQWSSRYSIGQNWASKNYKPSGGQYTSTYNKTGFADLLDVFVTGAYSEKVWISEDPSTEWTVENFVKSWDKYIMGECKCYGSIAAYALDETKNLDATYLCLKYTNGYMTFELSHVNNRSLWESTKKGIMRYEDPVAYLEYADETLY